MKLTTKTVIKIFNNLTKTESCQYKSLGSNTAPKLVSKFLTGYDDVGVNAHHTDHVDFISFSCDFARTKIKKSIAKAILLLREIIISVCNIIEHI